MEKKLFISIAACLFAGMLLSCGGNKSTKSLEKAEGLEFDSIVRDTVVSLASDPESPKAELHLNIKYAKGENAATVNDSIVRLGLLSADYLPQAENIKDVRQAVDAFVADYVSSYKKDYGELYAKDKEHGASYNIQYILNTSVKNEKDGIINYISELYNYSGGAHGISVTVARNIDVKNGKIVALPDLLVPGYEQPLTDLIVKELCKKNDAKSLKELQDKGIFMGMDAYVTDNFIVKKDGIEFIYVDTEIAPHSEGEIRVNIGNSDLKDLFIKK